MRLRTDLSIGFAVLAVLGTLAAALGTRAASRENRNPRRSTFLTGPFGARGYADALTRLGVTVERYQRRSAQLRRTPPPAGSLLAVLDPTLPIERDDAAALAAYRQAGHDLLLAGAGAQAAARCLGYDIVPRRDSVVALLPGVATGGGRVRVGAVLARWYGPPSGDSAAQGDAAAPACPGAVPLSADTLAATSAGWPAALALMFESGGRVLLVADGGLFTNRALRESAAGEFALGLIVGHYRAVAFDEYHQGFGTATSLSGALVEWSLGSPWGWALWQVAAAGVVAVAAAGIRFGAPRPPRSRRRRSSLEHLRALAAALSAARGHDVAVRLIVQGLRRRLERGARGEGRATALRADPVPWLATLDRRLAAPRARTALQRLTELTSRPQRAAGVLAAANAVEDVWEEWKP